jgi:hypothetical protein
VEQRQCNEEETSRGRRYCESVKTAAVTAENGRRRCITERMRSRAY